MKKPSGYWNKENCGIEALKYTSKNEFYKKNQFAYNVSRINGWLDEVCIHMIQQIKPKGYWSIENSKLEALKYNTRSEFKENCNKAYFVLCKSELLDESCIHMNNESYQYWTKELCENEAKKYKTKSEFKDNSSKAYRAALHNGWSNEICSHMIELIKPIGYWTKEKCQKIALKYKHRSEFKYLYTNAYQVAQKYKWLDEICTHMIRIGSKFKRLIYSAEFSDKSVYIGLTYNLHKRKYSHFSSIRSQVYKYIQKTGLQPQFIELTDYFDKDIAALKEGEYVEKYKSEGWKILNKIKTGGLGGNDLKYKK